MQDAPARAEIRRIFWVFWCSQVDPPDQCLLCRHIVANALHVPPTSTICQKRTVIKSVLWLWSNGSLVAEIWPFQVGGVGYVHVCACMCRYMHICACIHRYTQVYMSICMYVHVCISMPSVSASIACIGPLGHGNHHSIPKTPPRDPAPGGTHSGHPRACARPLFDPIPTPPSDPIFRFFRQESVLGPVLPRP